MLIVVCRAKVKLIIIGSLSAMRQVPVLNALVRLATEK